MEQKNKRQILLLNNFISFLIILIFSKSVSQDLTRESIYSYVIMKIDRGNNKVFYDRDSSFTHPDQIFINGIEESNGMAQHQFNEEEENNAILIWNTPITNCNKMFKDCGHIIEIDFSHFNISQVNNMFEMFCDCRMLRSLDLSNFIDSNVAGNTVAGMFENCEALKYLDISNFITSQITGFGYMFYNCKSLLSLNLSKFDTTKIDSSNHMFYGCESLKYLDLSNFETKSLRKMNNMFTQCISLVYLYIKF